MLVLLAILFSFVIADLKISAFNMEVFGITKAENDVVMTAYVNIIKEFDIILLQEIRDISLEAFPILFSRLYGGYEYIISERLGRTSSKEQYVYLYKPNKVRLVGYHVYSDSLDYFEREPFIASFSYKNYNFTLIGIHVRPDSAQEEIGYLATVVDDTMFYNKSKNLYVLGDLNADCDYLSATARSNLILFSDPKYKVLISDDTDTTTGATDCAYDRIIVRGNTSIRATSIGKVFDFGKSFDLSLSVTQEVSDHYPIYVTFYSDQNLSTLNILIIVGASTLFLCIFMYFFWALYLKPHYYSTTHNIKSTNQVSRWGR